MTAEEFNAKYGITGGAQWVSDNRSSRTPKRSCGLELVMGGRTCKPTLHFGSEASFQVPALTAAQCVYIISSCCQADSMPVTVPMFPPDAPAWWEPEWLPEYTAGVRKWLNDDSAWSEFLTITAVS